MTYQPKVLDIVEMGGFVNSEQVYNGCRGQIISWDRPCDVLHIQPFRKILQPPTIPFSLLSLRGAAPVSFEFAYYNFKEVSFDFQIGDKAILQYPKIGIYKDVFGEEKNLFYLDVPHSAERFGIYHSSSAEGTEVTLTGEYLTVPGEQQRWIVTYSLRGTLIQTDVYEASLVKVSAKEKDIDSDPYNRRGLYLL